jgi:hypothetical protein
MSSHRLSSLATVTLVMLAALLSGCVGVRPDPMLRTGPGVNFDPQEVEAFRKAQDDVLNQLYLSAGLAKDNDTGIVKAPTDDAAEWGKVINAGMDYADQRCEAYMHALFRLNRDKNTAISQIGLVGAATAGILAAVAATAKEVAITAILFGLAASTVENYSSNLLYELEPSSVRTLVRGLQAGYKGALPVPLNYNTRPGAVAVIRGYAALCVPANIEAEVNLAIKKSQPDAKRGVGETGQPPAVSHNLPVASLVQIRDAERINLAVAALIKNKNSLGEINRVLKEVGASASDTTDFQAAAKALDSAFRRMKSDETEKWLNALRL